MSTIVMSAVWPLKMPPTPKAVLVSLADNANDHGVCWPSIATICTRTCFGRTAVLDAIAWLEQAGYLQAEHRIGRNSRYHIVLPSADLFHKEQPVRQTDQSARRTGPPAGPHPSASRTTPVRQPDPNHKEPSITVNSLSPRKDEEIELPTLDPGDDPLLPIEPTPAALACLAMKRAGLAHVNPSHPKLLRALEADVTAGELADVVTEVMAKGGAPPGLAYVCTTAMNRRLDAAREQTDANANQTEKRGGARPAGRQSLADQAAERAARIVAARERRAGDADAAGAG